MLLSSPEDHPIILLLLAALLLPGLFWWWNRRAKKWLEQRAKSKPLADPRPARLSPRQRANRLIYSEQEFREMVASALDEIPEEFDREWKNVAVLVSADGPGDQDRMKLGIADDDLLLGTYSGVARTDGVHSASVPHVIVIYQRALEALCGRDQGLIKRQIRKTVLHELAHHLGLSHERMRRIGL